MRVLGGMCVVRSEGKCRDVNDARAKNPHGPTGASFQPYQIVTTSIHHHETYLYSTLSFFPYFFKLDGGNIKIHFPS